MTVHSRWSSRLKDESGFGLVETLIALTIFVIGLVAGWFAGFETRFDFVPFFFRPVAGTLILLPLVYWMRLHLKTGAQSPSGNGLVLVISPATKEN